NVHLTSLSLSLCEEKFRTREMAVDSPTGVIIAAVFLHAATTIVCGSDSVLKLERLIPPSHELSLAQLRAFDSARHGRLLQSPVGGVVDFPVYGASDPFLIQLSFFDPGASSSSSMVSCSDRRCYSNFQTESGCSPNNLCSYSFKYGDGSGTSGYYISDFMSFDTVITSTLAINSSAPLSSGVAIYKPEIYRGLGEQPGAFICNFAACYSRTRTESILALGDKSGGGVMVLGQIKRPDTVYTPLVPSQPHYNVNLQSIAVNNQILPIDPSVFTIATGDGTIIDTGTTLAYLPDEAYVPFVQAISSAVSQYGRAVTYESYQCFDITSGAVDVFPEVSLNFAGGASMVLTPRGYLQMFSSSGSSIWCIGFQRMSHRRITILGDLVLKDKVVVYDLFANGLDGQNTTVPWR
ncbi:LOW QUALITY PROTEIN: hypothetical protein HID58_096152, partial [Brassica napus]